MKQQCKSKQFDDPASLAVIAIATGLLAPLARIALLSVVPALAPPRYHPPAHWGYWWGWYGPTGLLFAGAGALLMAFHCPPRLRLLFWLIAGVVISPLMGPVAIVLMDLPHLPSLHSLLRYSGLPQFLPAYLFGSLVSAVAAWAIERSLADRNRCCCREAGYGANNPAESV